VEGIPRDLPALTYAQLMQDRVARVGFEWEELSGVLDKVAEEAQELRRAATPEEVALHCVPSCKDFWNRERRVLLHWVTLCPVHGRYMEQHGGWKYIGGGGPHVPFVKDRDR